MFKTYIIVGILTVVMLAAIVYGIIESGSPLEARSKKFDSQRVTDISNLSIAIESYYSKNRKFPNSLGDVKEFLYGAKNSIDPETKIEYEYLKESSSYKLCATFATDSTQSDEDNFNPSYINRFGEKFKHSKGHYCFDLKLPDYGFNTNTGAGGATFPVDNRPFEENCRGNDNNITGCDATSNCSYYLCSNTCWSKGTSNEIACTAKPSQSQTN